MQQCISGVILAVMHVWKMGIPRVGAPGVILVAIWDIKYLFLKIAVLGHDRCCGPSASSRICQVLMP